MSTAEDFPCNVLSDGTGDFLIASRDITAGTLVIKEEGTILSNPTMHTVQIRDGVHVDLPGSIRLTNHSCGSSMNVRFDTFEDPPGGQLVALKDIKAGERLVFDYATTEWDMSSPFDCVCKTSDCRGRIVGFKHLTEDERKTLPENAISPFIRSLWQGSQ